MSRIMLNIARALCAAGVVTAGGLAQAQTIVKPAQVNEQTSHRYVMINAASWEAAQSWARALGGDLVTIDDAAENLWVWNTFSTTASKYMIGLKADNAGNLAWSDGSSSTYRNWDPGEPQVNSSERYACVLNQKWVIRSTNYSSFYVVEWSTSTIRVPEEFPALTDALNVLNAMGGGEVLVGPGTFTIPATMTLSCGFNWSTNAVAAVCISSILYDVDGLVSISRTTVKGLSVVPKYAISCSFPFSKILKSSCSSPGT